MRAETRREGKGGRGRGERERESRMRTRYMDKWPTEQVCRGDQHLGGPVLTNQDILGLEVLMHKALLVHVHDAPHDVTGHLGAPAPQDARPSGQARQQKRPMPC